MATWAGSTAGSNSGGLYAAVTAIVYGFVDLSGIRFYATAARTYTVMVDGKAVGSVASAGGVVEEITFAPLLIAGSAGISIVPDSPATVRYTSGTSFEYKTGVTQGPWLEFASFRLPWELLLGDVKVRADWEALGHGITQGRPAATAGILVNGGGTGGGPGPEPLPEYGRERPPGRRHA